MTEFQKIVGKTIESVEDDRVNFVSIKFTDGTCLNVYADCGTNYNSVPYFDVEFEEK